MYDFDRTEKNRAGQDRSGLTFSKLILFTLLFALFAAPGWADNMPYRYATVDTNNVVTWHDNGSAADPTQVTNSTTTWSNGGWYYVPANTNVQIATRVTVAGEVNLILCDGATLTATAGITVAEGNTLNIYGQTNGTGQLYAGTDGTTQDDGNFKVTCDDEAAGIGGNSGDSECYGGTVTIHGGVVTATGGGFGAGIGGGSGQKGTGGGAGIGGSGGAASGGSGGCDAGLGGTGLAALLPALTKKRK